MQLRLPNHNFRGQGIHMAVSLRDLTDASLENTSGPSFELRNSNHTLFELRNSHYANLHTHRPKYRHSKWSVTRTILKIAYFALVWKPSISLTSNIEIGSLLSSNMTPHHMIECNHMWFIFTIPLRNYDFPVFSGKAIALQKCDNTDAIKFPRLWNAQCPCKNVYSCWCNRHTDVWYTCRLDLFKSFKSRKISRHTSEGTEISWHNFNLFIINFNIIIIITIMMKIIFLL